MSDSQEPESWDDEFELDDPSPSTSRPRLSHDDEDNDFGLWGEDDEDKTLTARSRPARAPTPPPPVPPLPQGIQSPVPSVFSSGSNGSTAHLRPSISRTSAAKASVGFANLPPSPPIHQERRRLKKKSRPPTEGVYEMQEYLTSEDEIPSTPMGSPPVGSPLLQRIGSVKNKFSGRKKRASSTPSEVMLHEETTPRPATPPHNKSWFFRPPDAEPQSPKVRKRKSFGFVRKGDLPSDLEAALAANNHSQDRYGGLGLGRAGNDRERSTERPQEGSRSWMGNMRRISITSKHKRGVSVASGEPPPLLPPIELRPPSPFFDISHVPSSSEGSYATAESTSTSASPNRKVAALGMTASTTASLGRTTTTTIITSSGIAVPRRNSLGDLKIPARISQAQVGLRRDLTMVREFAKSVDELKDLQAIYTDLLAQVQSILASSPPPAPRPTSPSVFRPRSRSNAQARPKTLQALTADVYTINSKYRIAWECAELLVEIGGGGPPTTSVSAPAMTTSQSEPSGSKKSRERAITLTVDDRDTATPKPPEVANQSPVTPASWRASTGRHDLSQRQLSLLRDMLSPTPVPERSESRMSTNREWRWGDAMNSTVTLPSEESSVAPNATPTTKKKRRSSRMGMTGIRDMLRSLKKQGQSSTSVSTHASSGESSRPESRAAGRASTYGRRRAKTSSGPELMDPSRPVTPFANASISSLNRPSPRRPSLASIFKLGRGSSSKNSIAAASRSNLDLHETSSGSSVGRDEWDHMDDELSPISSGAGDTIRVRRGALLDELNRLSNVEEEGSTRLPASLAILKNASVRSMPEGRLAMTPENIRPLLENARDVKRQLTECIDEIRTLLDAHR